MKILFFTVLLLLMTGCSENDVISEDKFVLVYSDLLIAGDTTNIKTAKKIVYKKYNVKNQDYENTLNFYNSNPELWDPFFEKVIARIDSLKQQSSSAL